MDRPALTSASLRLVETSEEVGVRDDQGERQMRDIAIGDAVRVIVAAAEEARQAHLAVASVEQHNDRECEQANGNQDRNTSAVQRQMLRCGDADQEERGRKRNQAENPVHLGTPRMKGLAAGQGMKTSRHAMEQGKSTADEVDEKAHPHDLNLHVFGGTDAVGVSDPGRERALPLDGVGRDQGLNLGSDGEPLPMDASRGELLVQPLLGLPVAGNSGFEAEDAGRTVPEGEQASREALPRDADLNSVNLPSGQEIDHAHAADLVTCSILSASMVRVSRGRSPDSQRDTVACVTPIKSARAC